LHWYKGNLNLAAPSRALHPWQAFSKLFSEDLKPKVAQEWKDFCATNPESTTTLFAYRNSLMKKWYAEAGPDIKAKVESFWQEQKSNGGEGSQRDCEASQMTEYQK